MSTFILLLLFLYAETFYFIVIEEPKIVAEDPVPYVLPDEDTQVEYPEQAGEVVKAETTLATIENMTETTDS